MRRSLWREGASGLARWASALALGLLASLSLFAQQPAAVTRPLMPRRNEEPRRLDAFELFLQSIVESDSNGRKRPLKCMTCQEERLQKFWQDYYEALRLYYLGRDLPAGLAAAPARALSVAPSRSRPRTSTPVRPRFT